MNAHRGFGRHESEAESLSFLLRLWQVTDNGGRLWRVSLEDSVGNQRGFADLASLAAFLQDWIASAPEEGLDTLPRSEG